MYCIEIFSKHLLNSNKLIKVLHRSNHKVKNVLLVENITKELKQMDCEVESRILARAKELMLDLEKGSKKEFKEVILTNIEDAQGLGQPSLTFVRQVLTLTLFPKLLQSSEFPSDAKGRASEILASKEGRDIGSCSHFQGIRKIREHVANYIMNRDGYDPIVDPDNIILSDGATPIIKCVLNLFAEHINLKPTGCLVPIPHYPFYSLNLTALGLSKIGYLLDEENNWALNMNRIKCALHDAKEHCNPRVIVIINPGNPTGHVLSQKNLEDVIKFAYKESLFILADEVYQDNVRGEEVEFISVRKTMVDLGMPYSRMELISFNSASKGYAGESGFRGGYAELYNVNKKAREILLKAVQMYCCPNNSGQVVLDTIICPPKEDQPSCKSYMKEKTAILRDQENKANLMYQMFNKINGVRCSRIDGALYAFPKITLPKKFIEECKAEFSDPNEEFCMQLLNKTGITVTPGTCFGQAPDTYHFRITILPPVKKLQGVIQGFEGFYKDFRNKYGG